MKEQKIALIHQHDCHKVIKNFAFSITNNFYEIKKLPFHVISGPIYSFYLALTLPEYDIYFTDSAMSNLVPIFKRWFGNKNIIIYRGGDGIFGEKSNAYLYTKNVLKKKILLYILRNIDGIITESEMSKKDAQHWISCPVQVAVSYVSELYSLRKIKPDLNTNRFLFIGEYRPPYDHKGINNLIRTFNCLGEKYELYIVGGNTQKLRSKIINRNIHLEGKVKDLKKYFNGCSYYIHLAKYETGPITVLEAMAAGLIPIVSHNCGHKDIVSKVSPDLIIPTLNIKQVTNQIHQIYNLELRKKNIYSKIAKRLINSEFSKESRTIRFKNIFYQLVKEIERKRTNI